MQIRRIEEKCNLCMRCVQDCVSGVWRLEDDIPTVVAPELCNRCSHCLTVCPKNAIENEFLDEKQTRRIKRKNLNPETYEEIVLSRRSVRQYKDKPIDKKTIERIINLVRHSPTATNSQHVGYIIISDPNRLKNISNQVFSIARKVYDWSKTKSGKLIFHNLKVNAAIAQMMEKYIEPMDYYINLQESGRDLILHNAPVLILMHAPSLSFFASDNCNIAATNIINYAHATGLGTCFIGFVTLASRFDKQLCKLIELPKGQKIYASIVMGHPLYPHAHTASRKTPEINWII